MCKICQEFLVAKIQTLAETANKAVHDFEGEEDDDDDVNEEDDSTCEEEDHDEFEDETPDEAGNTQTVLQLVNKVRAWRRFESPQI